MTIRERQLVHAFALVENARQTILVASQVLGNLRYGESGNIIDDFHNAAREVGEVCRKLEEMMDSNTEWSFCSGLALEKEEKNERNKIQS